MRPALLTGVVTLLLAAPAWGAGGSPSAAWLAQARCVHLREGDRYFGGMQFAAKTWRRAGGKPDPAFSHPGDPGYPFSASAAEQLYRAWRVWKADGGSWRSWGAVGAACSPA